MKAMTFLMIVVAGGGHAPALAQDW